MNATNTATKEKAAHPNATPFRTKDRPKGVWVPGTAKGWCYMCGRDHLWADWCAVRDGVPADSAGSTQAESKG